MPRSSPGVAIYVPLTDATWLAEQSRLSRALAPRDLVFVATFYMRVGFIRYAPSATPGVSSPNLVPAAGEAFVRSAAAAKVLEERGWWPWERAAVRDTLRELVIKA